MRPWDTIRRIVTGSLTRKLVLAILLINTFMIAIVTWKVIAREGNVLEEHRLARVEGITTLLATSGAHWMISEDLAGLSELVDSARTVGAVRYAMFIDASGRVLAHTDRAKTGTFIRDVSLLERARGIMVIAHTNHSIDVVRPVLVGEHRVGWAWVSISLADIRERQKELIVSALGLGAIAVGLAVAIAILTGRGITRRLEDLAYATDRFRLGERNVRVVERGRDEVTATARGVNAMFETVAQGERSLEDAQRIAHLGSWRFDPVELTFSCSDLVMEMFGFDPAEGPPSLGRFLDALPPEQKRLAMELFENGDANEVSSFVLNVTRPDGTRRICWVEARSEVDRVSGTLVHLGICQDITDRESAAEQLRQAQKMEAVGQLTGGLAHDFNNLLAIIIGNLDLLNEAHPDGEARECAEEALGAALRGSELTKQLLAFSRRQPLAPQTIDLNPLVAGMATLWRRTVGESIRVRVELAEDLWPTRADPSQVESSILNLVINARDAMPAGGMLTVETRNRTFGAEDYRSGGEEDIVPGDYCVITVSDTGCGMSAETAARAFEPFFTTKPTGQGTGLGLSMIYGFARQSAGHARIYSEPGHGTAVSLYLPRADRDPLERSDDTIDVPTSTLGETILLVEDDDGVRRIATRQLRALGYQIITATDGPEALAALAENPQVSLLFSDVVMPGGMNGIALAEQAVKANPMLRVLLTSGFTRETVEDRMTSAGSTPLLRKPYRRLELAAKIRHVLNAPIPNSVERT